MKSLSLFYVLLSLLVICSLNAAAQNASRGTVTGKIKEAKTNQVVEGAIISVMNLQDSVSRGTLSDKDGLFSIKNLPLGNYKLFCSYFGFKEASRTFSITKEKPDYKLPDIQLDSAMISLSEVTIIAEVPPVVIKKDTTEFNAGSFKTKNEAVVEEIIKQLPGVDVDKDGSISTQGQKITAVLVDGKPFFGNDPKLATQNLPANIVNKIQVITVDPEKAEDGQSGIIINITIKKDKKKGYFGNTNLAGGTNNRYKGGLNLNRFNNEQKLSIISSANNVTTDGGISNSFSGGVNFNTPLTKKTSVALNYVYNLTENKQQSILNRNTLLPTGELLYADRSSSSNNGHNHQLGLNFDYKINPLTKVNISPRINFRKSDATSSSLFESSNDAGKINDGDRSTRSSSTTPDFSNTINFTKRFKTKGRRINLSIRNSYNANDQTGFNYSLSNFYTNGSGSSSLINQKNLTDNNATRNSISFTYSEPLFKDHALKFNYDFNNSVENSARNAYDFNELNGEFDLPNTLITNVYRNRTNANRIGTSFDGLNEKIDYSVGISIQKTDLRGYSITKDSLYFQNKLSLIPQVSFNYKISKYSRISTTYKGEIRQPSITDLQPTPDNTNPLYIKIGNPDLQSEFNNILSANYSSVNALSDRSTFANLSFGTTFNKITYNSFFDTTTGKQMSRPENVSGAYNLNLNLGLGIPFRSVKTKPSLNTSLAKDITYINGQKSTNYNIRCGLSCGINYRYENKLDFNMNYSGNYNNTDYGNPNFKDVNYLNLSSNINITYYLPKNFALNSDVTYSRNGNQLVAARRNITLLNAGIYKEFFKNKAKLALDGFDLLKQNTSINRTIANNQIEDRQSNNVSRYYMLTFSYRFNKFDGGK